MTCENCKKLQARIDELEEELEGAEESHYRMENLASERKRALQDAEYRADNARREEEYRQMDRESAIRDLKKAQSYHDEYAESKALRRLKDLA